VIDSSSFRFDIYYRALDRHPGGNDDDHTVCFSFTFSACSNSLVVKHCQYYGPHTYSSYTPEAEIPISTLIQKIQSLLPALGINSECKIYGSGSENDTEWSSKELLILSPRPWKPSTHRYFPISIRDSIKTFLLVNYRLFNVGKDILHLIFSYVTQDDPGAWTPVFRLHQSALERSDNPVYTSTNHPNTSQKSIFDLADELLGMSRVYEWSVDGDEEPCKAAMDRDESKQIEKRKGDYSLPHLMPFYFR